MFEKYMKLANPSISDIFFCSEANFSLCCVLHCLLGLKLVNTLDHMKSYSKLQTEWMCVHVNIVL